MPKLKTKSGAKKRFKMTGTGKVKVAAQGKRHGMIKRTAKFVRNARAPWCWATATPGSSRNTCRTPADPLIKSRLLRRFTAFWME